MNLNLSTDFLTPVTLCWQVLFTGDTTRAILRCPFSLDRSNKGGEQDIQLTNDKRIVAHYNDPKSAGKTADPGKFTPWVTMYNNQPQRRHFESRIYPRDEVEKS